MRRLLKALLYLITLALFLYFAYANLKPLVLSRLGLSPQPINISGTGSMYPTFPKGQGKDPQELSSQIVGSPGMFPYPNGLLFFGKRYLNYSLSYGDIVVFKNEKTDSESQKLYGRPGGLVKRLVGLPGDSIELRDGLVYRNGQILDEPYTAKARSTFGSEQFSECTPLRIPGGQLFVLGDNRTASSDSRHELGLVAVSDIDHVLPLAKQTGLYTKYWRDTSRDQDPSSAIHLDKAEYTRQVNLLRKSPLQYDSRLEKTVQIPGYTTSGTLTIPGHYTTAELLENQLEFPKSIAFLTHPDYQAIGIAEVPTNVNGCPGQEIVIRLAGFVPPNYSQSVIDSWTSALTNLQQVAPSWQNLKNSGDFYTKNKISIDRINDLLILRTRRLTAIVARMHKNEWLTPEEKSWADQDPQLSKEQFDLSNQLKN